jgi:calnexin
LIAKDDKIAASYRETTWKPKFTIEKEKQKEESDTGSSGLAIIQVMSSCYFLFLSL